MNRQRWSTPRLKAALDACEARLSSMEDAGKTEAEVAALEEATALLANRLAPPSHDALLLSPRERIALDALLAGECTSVTLASVLTKLRRLP